MLQILVPKFMKDFDKKLLLNYPFWYIVKIHYIIYFTVFMWLLSYMIGTVLPIDISSNDPVNVGYIWIFLFSVLSVILFCIWMYYLTIYNNEDHFGRFHKYDDVKFLGVFIVAVNLLMSFSYPMQYQLKTRLANIFTDAEFAEQINTYNLANKYMTSNIEDFQYCGYGIHDSVTTEQLQKDTSILEAYQYSHDLAKYYKFKNCSFDYSFHNEDFGNFLFLNKYKGPSSEYNQVLYSAKKIEQEYDKHKTESSKLNAITHYFNLVNLYKDSYSDTRYGPQDYLNNYNHIERKCVSIFPEAYNLRSEDKISSTLYLPTIYITHKMENIYKAKFSLPGFLQDEYLLFAFYFSFFISLFIILFRNNKWQHYLVSVVSFILIGIILGIVSAIFKFISFESLFPTLCLLTWLAAGIISLNYYFKKDRYNVVGVVASNLFYVCLPMMPFFISVYCHETFGLLKCDYTLYGNYYYSSECFRIQENYDNLLMYTQIIGIAAFVALFMPIYKLFYVKQKALPRNK